ncbi:hypothetical protein ACP4OV_009763 [Aristida adscensionis]
MSVQADAGESSPPAVASKAPVTPVGPPMPDDHCPLIRVPGVVDACRSPPGLAACVWKCKLAGHRGGHCHVQPSGVVPGDCTCIDCIGGGRRPPAMPPTSASASSATADASERV